MKKMILIFFLFISLNCKNENPNDPETTIIDWNWIKQIEGNEDVITNYITLDNSGNVYLVGGFSGVINIQGTKLTSHGNQDVFIAKFNSSAQLVWIKQTGGSGADYGSGLCIDNDNIYVTGGFSETAKFDKLDITSQGDLDMFVMKLNSSGDQIWVKQIGGTGLDCGKTVQCDNNGNFFVAGIFSDIISVNSIPFTSHGSYDIIIMKFNSNTQLQWAKQAGGMSDDDISALAIDQSGKCFISGHFKSAADFGSYHLSAWGWDMFVSKLDLKGNFEWVKQSSGPSTEGGNSLALDNAGNCYVTGCFYRYATFDNITINSLGLADVYVAKYSNSGSLNWVISAGGNNEDVGHGIATDDMGNCYVTGVFQGSASFGNSQIISKGNYDIFITKIDPSSNILWTISAGGTDSDDGSGIFTTGTGNCYICGNFRNFASFGNKNLTSAGLSNAFIGMIAP